MTRWGITRKESICLTCLTSPTPLVGMKWGGSCTILRDFSPIALFLILGGLLFVWGVLYGMLLWIRTLRTGLPTPTGTIVLTLVPLILGFQLLLQGIVLDIEETPR
jgi:hypothetical protein